MAYAPPTITAAGLSINTYSDIQEDLASYYQGIYGQNTYLGNDAADYQDISANALKHADVEAGMQQVYLNISLLTAVGAALDSLVKLVGIQRKSASYSTAQLTISGTAGAVISNGIAQDVNGNLWNLPAAITIPQSGSIVVTATAQIIGNVNAESGQINVRYTPTAGWTSVTNAAAATPGQAMETDGQLRARALISQAGPGMSMDASLNAVVAAVEGVTRSFVYENYYGFTASFGTVNTSGTAVTLVTGYAFDATDVGEGITISGVEYTISAVNSATSLTLSISVGTQTGASFFIGDGNAIGPKNSITAVVEGGASADIAQAIYSRKGIGALANGTTSVVVTDPKNGNTNITIGYDVLGYAVIYVAISVHGLTGFTSATQTAIQTAVVNYLNSLGIGESVVYSEIWMACAGARPNPDMPLFSIKSVTLGLQAAATTGTVTSGSETVTVASATGIASGQTVVGSGIPNGTTITISGTTVTLSQNATASDSNVPLSFFATGSTDIAVAYNQAASGSAGNVVVTTT